jgi:HIV Tat-specific factor 1
MQSEKNLVEEALIQMKQIEDVLAENAKGILASTMKEEIKELVKESLNEQADEDDMEMDMDSEDDMEMDIDDEDDMEMDDEDEDEYEMEDEDDMEMDDDVIDMRGASQSELLKVFKAMGDEDGIVVSKDGGDISLTDDGDEYLIRLGEQISEFGDEDMEDDYEMDMEDEDEMDMEDEDDEMGMEDEDDEMGMEDEDDEMGMEDDMGMEYEDDEMGEMYEDDTQSTIDKIFEKTRTKNSDIIYEIEIDEQMEDEDEYDMEDDMEDDMGMEDELSDIKVDCDNFSVSDFIEEYGVKDAGSILKVLEFNGCVAGKSETSEEYDYLGEAKKASKFKYKMAKNGFNEKMKEGPKKMVTGKAKFDYDKSAANIDGKMKKVTPGKKQETKEASRTYGMGSKAGRGLRKGITPNRNLNLESLEDQVLELKQRNSDYKKSLNIFREKLNDVAVFNANLAYATRLFTEHSTTKKEKINILRRFDNIQSLQESKNLYSVINNELSKDSNTSLNESVNRKISNVASTGSSANLIESKTYENPQFLRMKDLMGKLG